MYYILMLLMMICIVATIFFIALSIIFTRILKSELKIYKMIAEIPASNETLTVMLEAIRRNAREDD